MNGTPRMLNALLGAWLFISAFVWHHGQSQFTNTCFSGIVILIFAFLAGASTWARFMSVAAAVWLFFSTLLLPRGNLGTVWHNCIVAVIVFAVALMPSVYRRAFHHGPR